MLKSISAENYTIRPFVTHKAQTYGYVYSGSTNPSQIAIDFCSAPPLNWTFYSNLEVANTDGLFQSTLYKSIKQLFYTSASFVTSSVSGALAGSTSGTIATFMNWGAGGDSNRKFPLSSSAWVISVAQIAYGEGIRAGTFILTAPTTTASIADDSKGRLYVGNTGSIVGNIFYNLGIAVINNTPAASGTISPSGLYLTNGSTITASFNATQTIYEHQVIATIDPYEFNFSTNISAQTTASSGEKIPDLFLSGNLTPYVTTIGFYNSQQELVAVAKLNQPVKRILESQQSFIVRLDA